jgi:hypothetical protein
MFFHGFGYGPHPGFLFGGPGIILMFFFFMIVFSLLRRARYGGYRGYRGNPRYQRPYWPQGTNPYQGPQPPASEDNPEVPRNESQYYGCGDAPNQNDQGLKTVRTGTNAEPAAPGETGTPTTRVDRAPGSSGEPTRPLQ